MQYYSTTAVEGLINMTSWVSVNGPTAELGLMAQSPLLAFFFSFLFKFSF